MDIGMAIWGWQSISFTQNIIAVSLQSIHDFYFGDSFDFCPSHNAIISPLNIWFKTKYV